MGATPAGCSHQPQPAGQSRTESESKGFGSAAVGQCCSIHTQTSVFSKSVGPLLMRKLTNCSAPLAEKHGVRG